MVTLIVDRLHVRYLLDRPGADADLDAQLRRVVDEELDRALAALVVPAGHVCLRQLTVPVRLAGSGVGAARSWAEQLVGALDRAIAEGDGVVVYPRTLDALVDLLVSVGRADLRRAWAWRQVGLLAEGVAPTRPDAVAAALVARPELACAALAATAARGPVPLPARGWVAVAKAVDGLVGSVSTPAAPASATVPSTGSAVALPTAAPPAPDPPCARFSAAEVLGAPVARRLPTAAVAALPSKERLALARLVLLCSAPALARSSTAALAVAAALAGPDSAGNRQHDGPAGMGQRGDRPDADRVGGPPHARGGPTTRIPGERRPAIEPVDMPHPGASAPSAGRRQRAGAPSAMPDRTDGSRSVRDPRPAASASPVGGVLFLIAVAAALDLPSNATAPWPAVLGWAAARLGGVALDDPAVAVLAGWPRGPLGPPEVADEASITALVARVQLWVRTALGLDAEDDLGWLWRRPAWIIAEQGWVEAAFELSDVDTRVRAAGLDLDPGFVWWLGAVVRYRYG